MRKIFSLLLLVPIVIGMVMPAMADTKGGSNENDIDVDVGGAVEAANLVDQSLDNDGDQTNVADVATLVGDTEAVSAAEANADASGEADAEADDGDDDNVADASDNEADADADSGDAAAIGGIAASDVDQENEIDQDANADVLNEQLLIQGVLIEEIQDASAEVDDSPIVEDNEVEDDSELEVDV